MFLDEHQEKNIGEKMDFEKGLSSKVSVSAALVNQSSNVIKVGELPHHRF